MNNNELKQKLQEAKDFWNTPFDELIEQGYGTIEDPEPTKPIIGQTIELQDEFKGPRDLRGGFFAKYKVVKINRVTVLAYNMGTFINHTLRINNLK